MRKTKHGNVRIIGGRWRGRRLPVPDLSGLRPSGDRGRETLFNWLQPFINGARCVDLFAGTGVLGLEAVSRGAESVELVEKSPVAARSLRGNLSWLENEGERGVTIHEMDALSWLRNCQANAWDIVFVDPPFGSGLERKALDSVAERDCVRPGGLIYLETARKEPAPAPAPGWDLFREKCVGDVRIQLFRKQEIS
jgi:16S rRNA (guanine966-N2)-methyltransferase